MVALGGTGLRPPLTWEQKGKVKHAVALGLYGERNKDPGRTLRYQLQRIKVRSGLTWDDLEGLAFRRRSGRDPH